jgi:hypothetical protein
LQITPEYEVQAEEFYSELLAALCEIDVPTLVGGTYAVKFYTGIKRPTKDIDVFCKAGDYPKLLKSLQDRGFQIEIVDDRWLAKVIRGDYFGDVIWGSIPGVWPIDDTWTNNARKGEILGYTVNVTPPEELLLSKMYRQGRTHFDGPDVIHLILKQGRELDWKRLLNKSEPNWEVLLSHLIMFRFVYPADRNNIPKWLLDELIERLKLQLDLPEPQERVCRGSMLSHTQYQIAYTEWGYKDITDFFYRGEHHADPGH